MSDQFKTVAKRVFVQVTASEIQKACPPDKPFCQQVTADVANAFTAAMGGDRVALKGTLNDFLVRSSVAAGLNATLGSLVPEKADPVTLGGLTPLLQCVAARIAGKRPSNSCQLSGDEPHAITLLFDYLVKHETLSPSDLAALLAAWKQLSNERRLEPSVALTALAVISSTNLIGRPDLRVYLLALADWAKQGLTGELFAPTYAYLVNLDASLVSLDPLVAPETAVQDVIKGDHSQYFFWNSANDAATLGALNNCPDAVARFKAWIQTRGVPNAAGSYAGGVETWRQDILRGLPMNLSPLTELEGGPDCADPIAKKEQRKLRRSLRYMHGALNVAQVTTQYGVAALTATMLLDYVRDRDDAQLLQNLRAVLLFATARFELYAVNHAVPAAPSFVSPAGVLQSCEYQKLALDFGVPVSRVANDPNNCLGLFDGATHAAPAKAGPVTEADALATLTALRKQLAPLLDDKTFFDQTTSDTNLAVIAKAIEELAQNNKAAAERTLIRLGVDFLVLAVDDMSTNFFHVSEESCKNDTRSRSIFTGIGAGCAAHLLIQAAYHPIADWYWDQGASSADISAVADSVYRDLLASPYLDSTPVIFNVGLGANYVVGPTDTWGKNGYGTLTLLDKIGLAFYRYDWQSFRLETGPFVGGFLDALVRTAASTDKAQRYWLLGYTIGTPKMWSGDFGVELHVAAAMPFELSNSSHYGFTMGGALVVPFNFVFQGDNDGK